MKLPRDRSFDAGSGWAGNEVLTVDRAQKKIEPLAKERTPRLCRRWLQI
jgi:hypothetical protein